MCISVCECVCACGDTGNPIYFIGGSSFFNRSGPIKFYNRGEPYYEFTNFYEVVVEIDGKHWPTTEHYFQAQKFVGTPILETIRMLSRPREAFNISRDPRYSRWRRPDWEEVKEDVMYKALQAKFSQHRDLRQQLLKTGDRDLIEHSPHDSYWGDGGDGTGKNRLGELLMRLRKEMKANNSKKKTCPSPPHSTTKQHGDKQPIPSSSSEPSSKPPDQFHHGRQVQGGGSDGATDSNPFLLLQPNRSQEQTLNASGPSSALVPQNTHPQPLGSKECVPHPSSAPGPIPMMQPAPTPSTAVATTTTQHPPHQAGVGSVSFNTTPPHSHFQAPNSTHLNPTASTTLQLPAQTSHAIYTQCGTHTQQNASQPPPLVPISTTIPQEPVQPAPIRSAGFNSIPPGFTHPPEGHPRCELSTPTPNVPFPPHLEQRPFCPTPNVSYPPCPQPHVVNPQPASQSVQGGTPAQDPFEFVQQQAAVQQPQPNPIANQGNGEPMDQS